MQQKNRPSLVFLWLLLFPLDLSAQENYIRTFTPRTETSPGSISEAGAMVRTDYFDASGRPVQQIAHCANTNSQDIVDLTVYDPLGRKVREYRPAAVYGDYGTFRSADCFPDAADQSVFYSHGTGASASRTTVTGANTAGKSGMREEIFVDVAPILRFSALWGDSLRNEGAWDGAIKGERTTDEDGGTLTVFNDALGRKILERRGHTGSAECSDTYFVYDACGFLRFVLPPACAEALTSPGTYALCDNTSLQQYAYVYRYDRRGNVTHMRMPGIDWAYTVYDGDGRPVLSQRPAQRSASEWNFMRYDGLGRLTMQGTLTTALSFEALRNAYADSLVVDVFSPAAPLGYDASFAHCTVKSVDLVNYYGGYGFLELPEFSALRRVNPPGTFPAGTMQTGAYIATLDTDSLPETSSFYYDRRRRLFRSYRHSALSGVSEQMSSSYNHLDQPTQSSRTYTFGDGNRVVSRKNYTYDKNGRELTATHYVQYVTPEQTRSRSTQLRSNTYDDLCRLSRVSRFAGKEQLRYSYTAQGRLKSLSSPYFSQTLHYGERASSVANGFYYNGRISSTDIMQGDRLSQVDIGYDGLGRYTSSQVYSPGSDGMGESFSYDCMGNITALSRNIMGTEEERTYSYEGNRIAQEHFGTAGGGGNFPGFLPFLIPNTYLYDANGNETSNNDRVMRVHYNTLNLPDSVYFCLQGNTLRMDYTADGRRVRTVAETYRSPLVFPVGETPVPQEPTSVTEEMRDGELVFRDGRLVELRTEGGWFSLWNDTLSATQVRPYFYVTDYLGSVRMTVDGVTGGVEQSLEYLPSGYVCHSENYGAQPYKFCGKELITMHGFDQYDSEARFQHDYLPRFTAMDPLAEKYYHASPYNYAGGDPVNAVDPSGRGWIRGDYGNDVFYFYDSRVNSQEDVQKYYVNADNTITYLGDNSYFEINGIRYDLCPDGIVRYKDNFLVRESFLGGSEQGIFIGGDRYTNLSDWTHNWYGKYLGPNNPITKFGYSYAIPPNDLLDYAAWEHDRAYDRLGAAGISDALFNTSTFDADLKLMKDSYIAWMGGSSANRLTSFLTYQVFANIVAFKYFLRLLK